MILSETKFTHFLLANTAIFREAQAIPKEEPKKKPEEKTPLVTAVEKVLRENSRTVDRSLIEFYRELFSVFLSTELNVEIQTASKKFLSVVPLVVVKNAKGDLGVTTYNDISDSTVKVIRMNLDLSWFKYDGAGFDVGTENDAIEAIKFLRDKGLFKNPVDKFWDIRDALHKCGYLDVLSDR